MDFHVMCWLSVGFLHTGANYVFVASSKTRIGRNVRATSTSSSGLMKQGFESTNSLPPHPRRPLCKSWTLDVSSSNVGSRALLEPLGSSCCDTCDKNKPRRPHSDLFLCHLLAATQGDKPRRHWCAFSVYHEHVESRQPRRVRHSRRRP